MNSRGEDQNVRDAWFYIKDLKQKIILDIYFFHKREFIVLRLEVEAKIMKGLGGFFFNF